MSPEIHQSGIAIQEKLSGGIVRIDRHDLHLGLLLDLAPLYYQDKIVRARIAQGGETVVTQIATQDIAETTNTTNPGDLIIINPHGESYIVPKRKIPQKYTQLTEANDPDEEGYTRWQARGYYRAIRNPLGSKIVLFAQWNSDQNGDENCYFSDTWDPETKSREGEPYIVEQKAFDATYHLLTTFHQREWIVRNVYAEKFMLKAQELGFLTVTLPRKAGDPMPDGGDSFMPGDCQAIVILAPTESHHIEHTFYLTSVANPLLP